MIKQLIIAATLLLIDDFSESIHSARLIRDFIILAEYVSLSKEMYCYIEYILYRRENTKITVKYPWLINLKLYQ